MEHTSTTTATKMAVRGTRIPSTPLKFLWHITKPQLKWVILAMVFAGSAAAISQSLTLFFKWIVDAIEAGNYERVLAIGILYPAAAFLVQFIYRLSGWMAKFWVTNSKKYAYDQLVEYTLGHSHGYFSDRFSGSLLSKVANVAGAMENFITTFLWTFLTATISLFITFAFIFSVDPLTSLIFLVLVVVLVLFNLKRTTRKRQLSREAAETASVLRGDVVDIFSNVSAVRQYSSRVFELDRVKHLSDNDRVARGKNWMFSEYSRLYNSAILMVFSLGMFFMLAQRWQADDITTGDFVFVLALMFQLSGLLVFIGQIMSDSARVMGEAEEGVSELIVPHEIVDDEDAKVLTVADGKVEWQHVTFEYGNNKVFTDFSLTIEPGQRVGLVGPSGAGKSTFVSLLLRQHDLTNGAITIDGQNIAEVTQDSLRAHIAVVPQEPLLFHRTIRENIAYGNSDATDEKIIEVAQKAQAHDFITSLSEGYDTLVGERGVKLSGGQKQRVAIARAMLKNAPILVLDEATSALDSESEVAIQKALHELMEGKTVIAIAHRLSTLREMDRILVLEAGQIVEDGAHSKLARAGGTYQKLWEHQAGGFLQE